LNEETILLQKISLLEIMVIWLLLLLVVAVDLEVETSKTPLLQMHTSSNRTTHAAMLTEIKLVLSFLHLKLSFALCKTFVSDCLSTFGSVSCFKLHTGLMTQQTCPEQQKMTL